MTANPSRSRFVPLACAGLMLFAAAGLAQPSTAVMPPTEELHLLVPQQPRRALPGCAVRGVEVNARIDGAIATTTMVITVTNTTNRRSEARLVLPVANGASIHTFGIDGIGEEPTAELLPRAEATRRYREIVSRMVDPGLLEFVGTDLIQTSVFPVEPGADRVVTLVYQHAMPSHAGRVEYVLPRSSSVTGSGAPWSLTMDVAGSGGLGPVFSPSHPIITKTLGKDAVRVIVPNMDEPGAFRLYAVTGSEAGGATCLMYPESDGKGYFLFMGDAPDPGDAEPMPRELTVVMDRSGSMNGRKIEQARESARQIIAGLRDGERFNIIDYAGEVRAFADAPVVKNDETMRGAMAYIDAIQARGSTNLHDALMESLRAPLADGYLGMVLFLTDGLATDGVTGEAAIRQAARDANKEGRRVFTFGVGTDVNAPLLDGVAADTRAEATFVLPNEDVELKIAQVFDKLDGPVMVSPMFTTHAPDGTPLPQTVNPALTFVHPDALGDLFRGSRVMLVGRYDHAGPMLLRVRSEDPDSPVIEAVLDPKEASTRHGAVPRLWAQKRIDALLSKIRIDTADGSEPDAELVDEVVRLSLEHGIMTEYTAFLASEDMSLADAAAPRDEAGQLGIAYVRARESVAQQGQTRSGLAGVAQSVNRGNIAAREMAPAATLVDGKVQADTAVKSNMWYGADMQVQTVSTVQRDQRGTLYRKATRWVDARLGEQADEEPQQTVEFGTDAYWTLVDDLTGQHRQWMLANRGEVYLINHGQRVLVKNPG